MTIRKLFAFIALLTLWLPAAACTPQSPTETGSTAVAAPVDPAPTPSPTTPTTAEPPAPAPTETAAAETPAGSELDADFDAFSAALQTALAQRTFADLEPHMSDPFGLGAYRSEWQQLTPADALVQLMNWLPAGAAIEFTPQNVDLSVMLDGQNPFMMLGPDVQVAAVWHMTGWGATGADEAMLFVTEGADGRYALSALLVAPGGFISAINELPIVDEQPAPVGLLYGKPDGSLWQVGADGEPVQLGFEEGVMPTLAPDGRHAFYQVEDELWLLDVAAGESRLLTIAPDGSPAILVGYHQWVNNTTILSGVLLDAEEEGPNFGHPTLIDITTGVATVLDSMQLMSSYPAVSAQGVLAYASVQRHPDQTQTAWLYDPQTGVTPFDPTQFDGAPDGAYTAPGWSADGRFLAWLVGDGVNFRLAIFDLEANTVVSLPPFPGAPFGGAYPNPVFSPDPSRIALWQLTNHPSTTGLWLYTQDGAEPLFIAHNGGESYWLNDHLLLFIDYDENFNGQLQQVDTLTGVRSVVTLPEAVRILGVVQPES